MPSLPIKICLNTALAMSMLGGVLATSASAAEFRYAKGVKPMELRANGKKITQKKFEAGMSRQIMKLTSSKSGKKASFDFTTINVVDDCSASITCGDGTVIECSVQGPGTCESGLVSIACITSTSSDHKSCPAG